LTSWGASLAGDLPDWQIETIENQDWLYRRLPPVFVKPEGTLSDKLYMGNSEANRNRREPDPDISVDWDRYTTQEQSLARAVRRLGSAHSVTAKGDGARPARRG